MFSLSNMLSNYTGVTSFVCALLWRWVPRTGCFKYFSDACPTQVPTFVLALGSLMPRLRSDAFFALSFFATRIVLHIALCVTLAIQRHKVTNGSFGPAIIMACILPLHAYWFSGCVKGLLKRAKTAEKSVPVTKLPVSSLSLSGMFIVAFIS